MLRRDSVAALEEVSAPDGALRLLARLCESADRLDEGWWWTQPAFLQMTTPVPETCAARRVEEIRSLVRASVRRVGKPVERVYLVCHPRLLRALSGKQVLDLEEIQLGGLLG